MQNGWNAVHMAAFNGHVSLVRDLVETYHGKVHQKVQVSHTVTDVAITDMSKVFRTAVSHISWAFKMPSFFLRVAELQFSSVQPLDTRRWWNC